ncbi:MAG: glycosyltransferase family 2 protein [Desulfobacterales bacterium]|jgi:glycosyltransferase involved in cell wall biosynthesis
MPPNSTISRFDSIDVVVPVYNEARILPTFYERISRIELPLNLIFVDNASRDGSVAFIESLAEVTLIRHRSNEGYGASLLDGIRRATAEAIVIIDADCEFPPEAIPQLIDALEDHPVVYGSRFMGGAAPAMPLLRRVGNGAISGLFNLLFRQNLTDLYTGFKALRRAALKDLSLTRKGFEHVLELGVRLAQAGVTIHEVPIVYEPRHTGRSKMNHVAETAKFISLLLKYRIAG